MITTDPTDRAQQDRAGTTVGAESDFAEPAVGAVAVRVPARCRKTLQGSRLTSSGGLKSGDGPARASPKFGRSRRLLTGKEAQTVHQAPQDGQLHAELRSPGTASVAASARLRDSAHSIGLLVPDPLFSRKNLGSRWSSAPASNPVPESNPQINQQQASVDQLRWARCPDHGRLHLVQPADVTLAVTRGYAEAVCGHRIAAEGLTINRGPSGALCMACVIVSTS
jgi:hypothetical protein